MRLFLGAHSARHPLARVPQAGFLADRTTLLDHLDLPARLMFDGGRYIADRVHVLDLAARAQGIADLAHRDVDVAAHRAFIHIAITSTEIAQDRAQLL